MIDVKGHMFSSTAERQSLSELTHEKLEFLENTSDFTTFNKIGLLSMLTRKKWVGELDIRRERLEHNNLLTAGLLKLGLPWRTNGYVKRDGAHVYWIQVGANQAILDYIEKYRDEIDSLEAGILYGYPLTAVLGFVDVLRGEGDKKKGSGHHKNAAEFYLSGVFSEDFTKQETDYFNEVWSSLKKVSPKIISEAESYFRLWQKEWDSRDKNKPFSYEECHEKWLLLRGNM